MSDKLVRCPKCKRIIAGTDNKCPHCGTQLSASAPTPKSAPQPDATPQPRRHLDILSQAAPDAIVNQKPSAPADKIAVPAHRSRKTLWISVAAIAVLAIIGSVWFFLPNNNSWAYNDQIFSYDDDECMDWDNECVEEVAVEEAPAEEVGVYVQVDGDYVRLRTAPSLDAEIVSDSVGHIYPFKGEKLEFLGDYGDWYHVDFRGRYVYISKQYSHLVYE